MIMGITWTLLESVWNPSGPSEVQKTSNWSGTIFCRFLQQTSSSNYVVKQVDIIQLLSPLLYKLCPVFDDAIYAMNLPKCLMYFFYVREKRNHEFTNLNAREPFKTPF